LGFVQHRLFQTRKYSGERVVVVGGGNSAAEAALALSEAGASVTLVHRGREFARLTKENGRRLREAAGIEVRPGARVTRFAPGVCEVDGVAVACDHAFVLIGSEPPREFLKALGIRLEDEWGWKRWAALAGMLALSYTIYGAKQAPGHEFWPFTGWGAAALSFGGRPWSFWYTVLYTTLMTVFGIAAMKRWGFDKRDKFQIWRYVSLIGFQWLFFFIIPEFLFQSAVSNQWVGERLASDPGFASNAWRSYGLVYAWPLFFYTFFGDPNQVWVVWGVVLSFVLIPLLVLFHGKRYCSWICGCGGLAETLGDRWRHLAPKGDASIRWERMNGVVLAVAAVITVVVVGHDLFKAFQPGAQKALVWYKLVVDTWLVGIIPVALYPFFGGKVWCRYWCPLAKMMELFSKAFVRFRVSRFAIASNDKCIACGECSRYCQVGIDVMRFALKQEELTNANSSCIGCGICVTVCPMDVLSFAAPQAPAKLVQIRATAAR
jgi:NosR/NirI family transcriptional regulator, nitrous oxide reductase regulator